MSLFDTISRWPNPENIYSIKHVTTPINLAILHSFFGLPNNWGLFPLKRLLKKDTLWKWSSEYQLAFDRIESLLGSKLLPSHYSLSIDIIVLSDVSNYGNRSVISQIFPDRNEGFIAYVPESLIHIGCNYDQIKMKL